MTGLTDATTGTFITEFVTHIAQPETVKVVSRALDGTTYMQIIGDQSRNISAMVYVDEAGKRLLEAADASGNLLCFESFGVTDYGRMTSLSFEHVGRRHYRAEIEAAGEPMA